MSSMAELLRTLVADLFLCVVAIGMAYDLARFRTPNTVSLALVGLFVVGALAAGGRSIG